MSSDESSVSGDHHHKGRCRHLFECKETSQILQEHALRPNQGDLMTDVFDCPLWKTAYVPNGLFQGNSRGLSVQLSTDGVNPFSAKKDMLSYVANHAKCPELAKILSKSL